MNILNISEWSEGDIKDTLEWLEAAPKVFWRYIAETEAQKIDHLLVSTDIRQDDQSRGYIKSLKLLIALHDTLLDELRARTQEDIDSNNAA